MAKSFMEILSESQKDYKYTVKLAVDDVTEEMLDCLENCLSKYEVKSASAFKKTPIQESPLDFPQLKNMPVFISDIVLSYPASRDMLQNYIANSLGCSIANVVVYSENDPRKATSELHVDRSSSDFKDLYEPFLGSEYGDDECGCADSPEDQKMDLLKTLSDTASGRQGNVVVGNTLIPDQIAGDDVLPKDYHDFDKQVPTENPGLFGRLKVKKAYEYIRK